MNTMPSEKRSPKPAAHSSAVIAPYTAEAFADFDEFQKLGVARFLYSKPNYSNGLQSTWKC